jgi:tRNA pseudouridine38-40 synthase
MRYFIELAFNGTPFSGWQIQPNDITVQEVLQKGMSLLLREPVTLTGCGRTDTGVHARQFYAHFDTEQQINEEGCQQLAYKLNRFLPVEIAIYAIFPVKPHQHARFDALDRTYCYYLNLKKEPFSFIFALPVYFQLDIEKMNEAASYLLEIKDFTSFSKLHTQVANNFCEVKKAAWFHEGDQLIFEITANRFLRNMVRSIVGTLLDVGKGKYSLEQFKSIIYQKDRCKAGESVPAHALFLEKVRYSFLI